MSDPVPCEDCAPRGWPRSGEEGGEPPGWLPIDRHPALRPAAWTPSRSLHRVVFCEACGELWRLSAERPDEALCMNAFPRDLLPLLGADLTVAAIVACVETERYARPEPVGPPLRRCLRPVFERYLQEARYDAADGARRLLTAMEPPGSMWGDLLALLETLLRRACAPIPPPSREEVEAMVDRLDGSAPLDRIVDASLELVREDTRQREARLRPAPRTRIEGTGVLLELVGRIPEGSSPSGVIRRLRAISHLLDSPRCALVAPPAEAARLRRFCEGFG